MTHSSPFAFDAFRTERRFSLLWLLLLLLIGYAAFWNGTGAKYYNDFYQHAFDLKPLNPLTLFTSPHPYHGFYRPVEACVHIAIQHVFGLNSTPVILLMITVHALLAWLVWLLVRSAGFSRSHAAAASLLMLLSQAIMYDTDSVACVSNVLSVFFGVVAMIAVIKSSLRISLWYFVALIALALSLFSKEAGAAYVGICIVILVWQTWRTRPMPFGRLLLMSLPIIALFAGYLLMRKHAVATQVQFGSGGYDLNLGLNIPKNCVMFFAAMFVSAPSPDVFTGIQNKEYLMPAIAAVMVTLLAGTLLYGLWRNRTSTVVRGAVVFTVASMFPMALMNHVSEHQVYGAAVFIAIMFGVGVGSVLEKTSGVLRYAFMGLLVAAICTNVYAIQRKAAMIKSNGEHTQTMIAQIVPFMRSLPPNGVALLVSPPATKPLYSIYLMNGFSYIRWGIHRIPEEAHRDDVKAVYSEVSELDSIKRVFPGALELTLRGDSVVAVDR